MISPSEKIAQRSKEILTFPSRASRCVATTGINNGEASLFLCVREREGRDIVRWETVAIMLMGKSFHECIMHEQHYTQITGALS